MTTPIRALTPEELSEFWKLRSLASAKVSQEYELDTIELGERAAFEFAWAELWKE